jgi:hypothetical protein
MVEEEKNNTPEQELIKQLQLDLKEKTNEFDSLDFLSNQVRFNSVIYKGISSIIIKNVEIEQKINSIISSLEEKDKKVGVKNE